MSMKSNRAARSEPLSAGKAHATVVSEDRIREHAHEIFKARTKSGKSGDSLSDWLLAERELHASAEPERLHHSREHHHAAVVHR